MDLVPAASLSGVVAVALGMVLSPGPNMVYSRPVRSLKDGERVWYPSPASPWVS